MGSIEIKMKAQFNDCDPMGIVWNGRYFDYFEAARSELLSKMGLSYMEIYEKGYMLPLVRNKIKYISPLKPGDEFVVKATVLEYDFFLRLGYEIRRCSDGTVTTKGESQQMVTDRAGKPVLQMPEFIIDAFNGYFGA